MTVFVDTSALFALLDHSDAHHAAARRGFNTLHRNEAALVTSNYVIIETSALLQNRLGFEAVQDFHTGLLPLTELAWITESIHRAATMRWLASGRRRLSLVDCCSFELMREINLSTAFAFDKHFIEEGFKLI